MMTSELFKSVYFGYREPAIFIFSSSKVQLILTENLFFLLFVEHTNHLKHSHSILFVTIKPQEQTLTWNKLFGSLNGSENYSQVTVEGKKNLKL